MGMIIQISEEKIDELAEGMEDMLRVGGRMMSCIENLKRDNGSEVNYRRGRMNYRDERYERDRGADGRYM